MKFIKKPISVEASQWFKNGDHPADYSSSMVGHEHIDGLRRERMFSPEERKAKGWEGEVVRYFRRPDVGGEKLCRHCDNEMHVHGWIDAGATGETVCPGDWIVTDARGNHSAVKPDVFAATYDAE